MDCLLGQLWNVFEQSCIEWFSFVWGRLCQILIYDISLPLFFKLVYFLWQWTNAFIQALETHSTEDLLMLASVTQSPYNTTPWFLFSLCPWIWKSRRISWNRWNRWFRWILTSKVFSRFRVLNNETKLNLAIKIYLLFFTASCNN